MPIVDDKTAGSTDHLAVAYVRNGWALCAIPEGKKNPEGLGASGWNKRENAITSVERAKRLREGVGLCHAWSGTCALDFDNLDAARAYLADNLIDADALLNAPTAVRISSGRPDRAKLLYRLPAGIEPLVTFQLAPCMDDDGKPAKALELRCAARTGNSVQDALPPTKHPKTGKPYVWEYGDDLIGDWRCLPELPADVLALWRSLIDGEQAGARDAPAVPAAEVTADRIAAVRALLWQHDPSSAHNNGWLMAAQAMHWDSQAADWGFQLFDEWSARGKGYPGTTALRQKWNSFRLDHPNPVTLASLRVEKCADVDDFNVIEAERMEANPVGDVPEAHLPNTDQRNAHRIRKRFSGQLISVNDCFHFWDGTRWAPDEGAAARCAATLSAMVKAEAKRARTRADDLEKKIDPEILQAAVENPRKHALGTTSEGTKLVEARTLVDTLNAWQKECEMEARQQSALRLLRRMLTVDSSRMNADPWALNCLNGTVDLRTGELRPHDPQEWITKLAPVAFDAEAQAVRFERFMLEITAGDAPMVSFLQRWFGYCATASVREQKFVIHIGQGANGKGTLLELITDVLGGYADTAAPGLLAGSAKGSDRHPTEIAKLFGQRMVTAHESDEGAALREGFIKQLTGGDRLTGRKMRQDFFDFEPTHKVQLLTNHKPEIKGRDFAIWRRVLLVPYPVQFGSADDLHDGKATALRDDALPEALARERAGVLRWIVEGAVEWYRGGLNPPDYVLSAGREYQTEQDRIGQFISECCELGRELWAPISGTFDGLYSAYSHWCRESGYQALGKGKFLGELERVVPYFRKEQRYEGKAGDGRRKVNGVIGLQVTTETAA